MRFRFIDTECMHISTLILQKLTLLLKAEKEEFAVELDCIKGAEALDIAVTGKLYCFRVSIVLLDKPSTVVNNWSFFGANLCMYYLFSPSCANSGIVMSHRVNNQEFELLLKVCPWWDGWDVY